MHDIVYGYTYIFRTLLKKQMNRIIISRKRLFFKRLNKDKFPLGAKHKKSWITLH